jgi:pyrophosphatase PpaX
MGHMQEIVATLFDIDGTLLDSTEFVYQAYEHAFRFYSLPAKTRHELVQVMGKPLEEAYRLLAPGADALALCEAHRAFQLEHLHLPLAFPHSKETLHRLKRAGKKIAAVTTRQRTSSKTLALTGLLPYIDVVISGEDSTHPKPHPESLLKALQKLAVAPQRAVMIGDTKVDILAGKNAGVRTIGVSYGFAGPDIIRYHPDFVVDDILDVLPLVQSS